MTLETALRTLGNPLIAGAFELDEQGRRFAKLTPHGSTRTRSENASGQTDGEPIFRQTTVIRIPALGSIENSELKDHQPTS